MSRDNENRAHPYLPELAEQLRGGKIERREFLRTATLLGLSAAAAYGMAGKITGQSFVSAAKAALPRGGTVRFSMRVHDLKDPHTYSWVPASNVTRQVCEYLTKTGHDNVTRPYLLERWEASEDLRTWTLHVRKGVKWRRGRDFTADDVVWNLKRVLDENTGSSMLGLMKGYMLDEYETGETDDKGQPKKATRLWDANAIERLDSHTVRLNAKTPQLAVPEHLFHYPLLMIDPEEGGHFEPGGNGTGAFDLVELEVGKKAVLKRRKDYWGEGPHLDALEFIDLGDDPSAGIGAMASKQVHGLHQTDIVQISALEKLPHVRLYQVPTAQTAVARMRPVKPFDDPRVRKAMRLATGPNDVLRLAHRNLGAPGEHHLVCPLHPDYAQIPVMERDPDGARKLLAEAGYPGGIDIEIAAQKEPAWELIAVQGMVEQWKEAGIRCRINVMPSAQYWEVWTKVPFGFTRWTHRPLGVMVLGLAYRTGVPWNESGYSNPEFDRLLSKAEGTLDVDERRRLVARLESIMQEDGPIVQPLWRSVFTAMDKRVQGFRMHPTSYIFGDELALGG